MNRLILFIISLLTAAGMQALTLQEARSIATERYPLMRDYSLIDLTEQYTVDNAAKAWLPQVSVEGRATWQSDVAAYPEVLKQMLAQRGLELQGMDRLQWKAQLDVRQIIWDGGRIKASQNVARCEADESRLSDDVELYQLRSRIDDIFFGILLLNQQREALQTSLTLLQANLDKVKALVRNGVAMQCDADALEAELLASRQQLLSVQCSEDSYRQVLELYIGERGAEPLQLPDDIDIQTGASDNRPELRLLQARAATLDARANLVRKETMPQIGAFAQGYFGYPGMNFMEAMMNRDPSFNALVGVSVSWNLGGYYTRKNKLSSLSAAADRIAVATDVFRFNTSVLATRQNAEAQRLRQLAESDSAIVALRGRVRAASEARLREGIVEPTDLLLRITEEKNAIISANTNHIKYLKAIYQLQNTLNHD